MGAHRPFKQSTRRRGAAAGAPSAGGTRPTNAALNLAALPPELRVLMLSHLDQPRDLAAAAATCRALRDAAAVRSVLRTVCARSGLATRATVPANALRHALALSARADALPEGAPPARRRALRLDAALSARGMGLGPTAAPREDVTRWRYKVAAAAHRTGAAASPMAAAVAAADAIEVARWCHAHGKCAQPVTDLTRFLPGGDGARECNARKAAARAEWDNKVGRALILGANAGGGAF